MKKIFTLIFLSLCFFLKAQINVIPAESGIAFNIEDLLLKLDLEMKAHEANFKLVFKESITYSTTVKEDGGLLISYNSDGIERNKIWSDSIISSVKLDKKYAGLDLNWNFQFGRIYHDAFSLDEVTEFPKVKVDPEAKVNFIFQKSVYRYYFEKVLNENSIDFAKGEEGVSEFELHVDENGKAIFLSSGSSVFTSHGFYEKIVENLESIDFPAGAKFKKKPCVVKYTYKFEYVDSKISRNQRLNQGQAFFDDGDFTSAAFEWDQINLGKLKADSIQFYKMAVGFYLGNKESELFGIKYVEAYTNCVDKDIDWTMHRVLAIDSADNEYGVSFKVVSRKNKVLSNLSRHQMPFMVSDVDKIPVFSACKNIKGNEEMFRCLNKQIMTCVVGNFIYPEKARKKKLQNKVYVGFVIEKDGTTDNVEVLLGKYDVLNIEAMRLISLLPTALPAMLNGEEVRMSYTVPINFKLK